MEEIECYSCKGTHLIKDLENTLIIKAFENLVKSNITDLFEYVKANLTKTCSSLEGKFYDILVHNYCLNSKI